MLRFILVILFLTLYLIIGIPILGIEWIISKFHPYAAEISQLRMVQWAFRMILVLSGTKLTVIGEENVPTDRPVLYIGNHKSFFDIVITYARCPRLTGYVSKDSMKKVVIGEENVPTDRPVLYIGNHKSFFDIVITYARCPRLTGYVSKDSMKKVPLLSLWMKRLHCLFLNREDVKEGLKTILAGIENIKNGISMCIFPEGTRNTTDELLLPFKEGSFKMAEKTGCPIIPMALTNSADIFENHLPKIKSTHVILQYGKPIYPNELDKETRKKLGRYCQAIIGDMLKEQRKEPH